MFSLPDMAVTPIPAAEIDSTFKSQYLDLVSASLGGKILAVSDEWFAPAINLLNTAPPVYSDKQVFTGQWMDGWETRRHNRLPFDYTIIRLGVASGTISAIEVDTAFFRGNEAPAISVEACFSPVDALPLSWKDSNEKWETILGIQPCGPSQRHCWRLDKPSKKAYTHVRLNMYPDGGIARFKLYGTAVPILPADQTTVFDLAAAQNGGMAVSWSDQEFGTLASNLLLPGRGPDMADGWETKRSRSRDHVDWVIVKLGTPGRVRRLVIDTIHFRGNFPDRAQVAGLSYSGAGVPDVEDEGWKEITVLADCEADKEHVLECLHPHYVFTHVRLKMYPDGGIKRLRVIGIRASKKQSKL